MNTIKLRPLLEQFFIEDIGDGDRTSDTLFGNHSTGEVQFTAKESGLFCGGSIILEGYHMMDPSLEVTLYCQDGDRIAKGQILASASGNMASLLKGERVILNLIQRMSGIATMTSRAVSTLNSSHTRICDTRKTTPGLRMIEKYAVRTGGGFNHRNGLYDAVMIKDNHIAFAGSITEAVNRIRQELGHMIKIEVEAESEAQVREAILAQVDCIMLDNQTPESIQYLRKLIPSSITTEASGGISLENLAEYRNTGVDYISLGCLTHSVSSLDISVNATIH
ncbi:MULTISPECIES: carboxylating nicotinate-nucleotide diphosphorylase [Pontibacillus]|uniref:nicotinate-nucleotide diphosphorylase (carboxylating) n=1 Tax=Pontibacillus chungwhensis TaxID=265426 RepID=A0ABY8UYD5_9BACI|nr:MULTISPECIES: carboxylating nicotinate-nucleotide diphosphorylase [Pontibacillus]MCD5325740.1 carboxylating nicotinate-nucleotide diphosphorylase [Pontibacillus sp. HN14]WIF98022.1 carboxylating nicotinate-nucleotide diphosphorylase [Pontibacillus chungwhensis]